MSETATSADVHVVRLEHGKANAIDAALLERVERELDRALDENKRAVVLTGREGFFSAGLNLKGLPETTEGMTSFVEVFETANEKLLSYPLPLVAAVNGHAIAGGCVLACTCDLRIGAAGDYRLGVSEVSLGIVFPASAFEIMRHTLTAPWTPDVLLGGRLLSPDDARAAGILHDVVPRARLLDEAVERALELGKKPPRAFRHSKLALRAPMLEAIARTRDEASRAFVESWFAPDVVARRKEMLAK